MADATHVLSLRDGLLSVAADEHVEDLSLSIANEVLELYASHPLGRLNIQGSALAGLGAVRLNGRELPVTIGRRRDSLDIPAAAWGKLGTRNSGTMNPRTVNNRTPNNQALNTRTVNTWEQEHEHKEQEPGPRNLDHGTVLCAE